MNACPISADSLGVIRGVLADIDCNSQYYAKSAYLALTDSSSFFPTAVNLLLVIYVAVQGIRLMWGLGQARMADAPVAAFKIGLVLGLALNWATFQTLVFDLVTQAPTQVARTLTGPLGAESALAADPIGGFQLVHDELGRSIQTLAQTVAPGATPLQLVAPNLMVTRMIGGQTTLFYATAGGLGVAMLALAALLAVGPLVIVSALFAETRGLMIGWIRATLTVAAAPLFAWIGSSIMLVMMEPWLLRLAQSRATGTLDTRAVEMLTALIDVHAASQAVLFGIALLVASGWRLPSRRRAPAVAPATSVSTLAMASASARPARGLAERALYLERIGAQGSAPRVSVSDERTPTRPGRAESASINRNRSGAYLDAYRQASRREE